MTEFNCLQSLKMSWKASELENQRMLLAKTILIGKRKNAFRKCMDSDSIDACPTSLNIFEVP
uniref:AlNc14C62G4510 protein n=2 Tax=Albugo laibachii Nc14 TaxID=890382 RepID=F0WCY6_9STRA|nr:AlNc14C62G4510 [Albugo laibachii Nc14]|eukprot:CCA19057.1 AlNc14C62G4510 [Albugo laibachii Nc14]